MKLINIYYQIKPFIPRRAQIFLRRKLAAYKLRRAQIAWPIDPTAAELPGGWEGWPKGKKFALVLHHDVDTQAGLERCKELMGLETNLNFRSSFNFVPEDYSVPVDLRQLLVQSGFEVGVHGLNHDGKLFKHPAGFKKRACRINQYLQEWNAAGFSSPSMISNLEWIGDLNIEYDCSSFDTDPFEPQPEGSGTIFPFEVMNSSKTKKYIELPYTLPQDHTLFVILQEKNIDTWIRKLDWIVENGGVAFLTTHPDYMNFEGTPCSREQYPASYYADFLEYVLRKYAGQYWHILPGNLARFWKERISRKN